MANATAPTPVDKRQTDGDFAKEPSAGRGAAPPATARPRVSATFEAALAIAREGRLYPAVILHGGDPSARRRAAGALARVLLCAAPPAERPCGRCRHCPRLAAQEDGSGFHPDFHLLERDLKTVTSVEATKAFLRGSQVPPFEAAGQVFVVTSAETLSGEAANALLKTLEEPPGRTTRHFLLLAPSHLDLLPTLRSRSLAVYLGGAARPEGEDLDELADELTRLVEAYAESGNAAELLAAAAVLKRSGDFRQVAAAEPWERAAAVAVRSAAASSRRRGLLELAGDLLAAPPFRARGVSPDRWLEGCVQKRLG